MIVDDHVQEAVDRILKSIDLSDPADIGDILFTVLTPIKARDAWLVAYTLSKLIEDTKSATLNT